MRENGLRAAAYVAVADLHPQLADMMLEALAEEGVAAYASPSPASSGRGLTMPTQLSSGPVDRLWVDRDATATARRILDDKLPELRAELESAAVETVTGHSDRAQDPDRSAGGILVDDDTWAGIIASYRAESAARPQALDGAPGSPAAPPPAAPPRATTPEDWPETRARASAATAGAPDDPHDHYTPPPPPPLPTADTTTRTAWAGLIGGPLLLVLSTLLDWDLASWAKLAAVAAMVVGFVTLIARMREVSDEDEGDHGAVV